MDFVAALETCFSRIDICVTNFSGPTSNLYKNTPPEAGRFAIDQLLLSTICFAKETLPRMQKNNWGRLITVPSSAVKQPVESGLVGSFR
jgi:3-oxoacyl-[acyl-carrier protein] reductase